MKYKWIELYGYAGIYNGMALDHIRIDFSKCKTNKIIIRGSNGSGKSTLMKAINPNPDNNDNFIPNMEARKNICLIYNGIEYIIRYIHPVTNTGRGTTKGYISKVINGNAIELNPNGNISSCKDILYEEFSLDSNYISLSSLSSENRGLVDSKPAERKKLINAIINTLEVYNNIYKNLSKKASAFKQLINSLTSKIDYIGNEAQLQMRLQNTENRLIKFEEEKTSTISAIAAVRLRIDEYMGILRDNNYDSIVQSLKDIETHVKILKEQLLKKANKIGVSSIDIETIRQFSIYLEKNISRRESEIESNKKYVNSLLSQREVEFRELQNKKQKLDSLQSEYNYLDIKNAVTSARKIIEDYDKLFRDIGLTNASVITKSEYEFAMNSLKYLKDLACRLMAAYSQDQILEVISNTELVTSCINNINSLSKQLELYKAEKTKIDLEIAVYDSKSTIIKELDNRPKACTIDDCPYIKSALQASIEFPKSKMLELQQKSRALEEKIYALTADIDRYANVYKPILDSINIISNELSVRMPAISKLPVRSDFKETFISRIANLDSFTEIDDLYKYIDYGNMIEEYRVAKEQLLKYESEYKIYEAKNDIIETIIDSINLLTQKTDDLMIKINDVNKSIQESQDKLVEYKNAKAVVDDVLSKLLDDLAPSEEKISELIKIKQALDINSEEISKLQMDLGKLNTNLGEVNNDIKNLSAERDTIKHSLIMLMEYKKELEEYSSKYSKIEKIRYYSSPSTGIQTLFMQLYMNKIIVNANMLLGMLFDGEFTLQPFIINESEFRIPCLGNGLIHDDISSMSTAQKCMISMILSFSILNQSSTKYNIISLDELDGGLDTMNRGFFIELLDKLMSMLQCEQCFIISHNNELNTSSADLIILKNNSNDIYDGNVIWQY